jgi:hypothetical protein
VQKSDDTLSAKTKDMTSFRATWEASPEPNARSLAKCPESLATVRCAASYGRTTDAPVDHCRCRAFRLCTAHCNINSVPSTRCLNSRFASPRLCVILVARGGTLLGEKQSTHSDSLFSLFSSQHVNLSNSSALLGAGKVFAKRSAKFVSVPSLVARTVPAAAASRPL